ncbi:hypothetical protein ACEQ8H_007746 [Pleosporales sp. CAS-2024a]
MSSPSDALSRRGHTATEPDHGRLSSFLEEALQNLSTQQAELVEAKEEIIIQRQRSASSALRVRKQREQVRDAEARFMDLIRTFHVDPENTVPGDLTKTYLRLEKLRNDLVEAEDDYTELTHALELAEWELLEKEEDLYQRDIQQLLHEQEPEIVKDTKTPVVPEEKPMGRSISPSPEVNSEPYAASSELQTEDARHRKSKSDGDLHHIRHMQKGHPEIEEWMFHCLREKIDYKLRFMMILQKELGLVDQPPLEYDHWEDQIRKNWTRGSYNIDEFQTMEKLLQCTSEGPGSESSSVGIAYGNLNSASKEGSISKFAGALPLRSVPSIWDDQFASISDRDNSDRGPLEHVTQTTNVAELPTYLKRYQFPIRQVSIIVA